MPVNDDNLRQQGSTLYEDSIVLSVRLGPAVSTNYNVFKWSELPVTTPCSLIHQPFNPSSYCLIYLKNDFGDNWESHTVDALKGHLVYIAIELEIRGWFTLKNQDVRKQTRNGCISQRT